MEIITQSDNGLIEFIRRTYAWMCGGLLLTALVAYVVASNQTLTNFFFTNIIIFYGLILLEIILVGYLAFRVQKMSTASAKGIFLAYAALNGVTLSLLFIIYTSSSIALTFLVTAGMFGLMSLYGYFTKKDLTTMGHIALMALFGLIIASLINLFLSNSGLYWITTYAGVLIFTVLIAYDAQKLKQLYVLGQNTVGGEVKESIIGALTLYLDFINLFINLLRIFGKRRD